MVPFLDLLSKQIETAHRLRFLYLILSNDLCCSEAAATEFDEELRK